MSATVSASKVAELPDPRRVEEDLLSTSTATNTVGNSSGSGSGRDLVEEGEENPEEAETEIEGDQNDEMDIDLRSSPVLAAAVLPTKDIDMKDAIELGDPVPQSAEDITAGDEREEGEIDSDELSAPPTDVEDPDERDGQSEAKKSAKQSEISGDTSHPPDKVDQIYEKDVDSELQKIKLAESQSDDNTNENEENDGTSAEVDDDPKNKGVTKILNSTGNLEYHAELNAQEKDGHEQDVEEGEEVEKQEEQGQGEQEPDEQEPEVEEEEEEEEKKSPKKKRKHDEEETEQERMLTGRARTSLTDIEVDFAKFRDQLYEDKVVRLNADIELCLEGKHPELAAINSQIEAIRDEKLKLANARLSYRRRCVENQTRSFRSHIHQQFYKNVANLRAKMISDITESWYKVNRERRSMDSLVPFYNYRVPDKQSTIFRQRQAQYQEIALLSGLSKYVGFPAAPEIKAATQDEIADDLEALRPPVKFEYS
ncbi:Sds3-like-domain-containing protein [Lipomyces oligophaga]|uniref:Sds3-like-domain-containing protein n=1 Tax=Lipomyces oligophaga TaxID=45792 RepID=UPI0034CF2BF2